MKFEVLLDNDPKLRDAARRRIETETGNSTENFVSNKDYPDFGNFIEVNASVRGDEVWQLHERLMALEGVVDVDPDFELEEKEDEINARYFAESPLYSSAEALQPDPDWYHHFVEFPEAIQQAKSAYTMGTGNFNDQRIKIAQLDTGFTYHPEVKTFKFTEGYNFLKGEDPHFPYDRLQSTRPFPVLWGGHGTSCAGTIIGTNAKIEDREPSPDPQLYFEDLANGIFPNVDLIPFRVSRNIISFTNKMAKAIQMIIQRQDIPIISISHATLFPKRSLHLAVKEAAKRGIIVVAAPGSHVKGFKNIFTYPAKFPETIAVAASDCHGLPWEKTHGGHEVDFCAPGYQIYIPFPYKKSGKEYFAYKWSEGSSFSVPITACAAALWLLHHNIENIKANLPDEHVVNIFRRVAKESVQTFPKPVDTSLFGPGILNVNNLLSAPLSPSRELISSSSRTTTIDHIKALYLADKEDYGQKKELAFLTLMAKLETENSDKELSLYIMDYASQPLRESLKRRSKAEAEFIKSEVKAFVGDYYS